MFLGKYDLIRSGTVMNSISRIALQQVRYHLSILVITIILSIIHCCITNACFIVTLSLTTFIIHSFIFKFDTYRMFFHTLYIF